MCDRECIKIRRQDGDVLECFDCSYDEPKPRTEKIISVETVISDEPVSVAEPTKDISFHL